MEINFDASGCDTIKDFRKYALFAANDSKEMKVKFEGHSFGGSTLTVEVDTGVLEFLFYEEEMTKDQMAEIDAVWEELKNEEHKKLYTRRTR